MQRRDEYRAYLRSDEWRKLSMMARFRSANRCELCGAYGDHVHHVRYPKRFDNDHIDNLIVVCEFHHSMLHGIRGQEMSGDLMVIDGVDVMVNKNEKWFDFKQIFSRLYECGVGINGSRDAMNNMIERAAGAAWGVIFNKYKQVTTEYDFSGQPRNKLWINQSGAFQLAAKYDSQKTEQFQQWLFEELIPKAVNGGAIPAQQATGDAIIDLGNSIALLANSVVQARKEAIETRQIAERAEQKVDDAIRRLDQATGGDFWMTARLALLKMGVDPNAKFAGNQTNAMALGAWCAQKSRERGLSTAPKIAEGTFMVNQFSKELLREGVKHFGFVARKPISNMH